MPLEVDEQYQREVEEYTEAMGEVDILKLEHDIAGGGPCVFELHRDEKENPVCPEGLLEEIRLFITEDDDEWQLTLTKTKMSKWNFDNLPEFSGW